MYSLILLNNCVPHSQYVGALAPTSYRIIWASIASLPVGCMLVADYRN